MLPRPCTLRNVIQRSSVLYILYCGKACLPVMPQLDPDDLAVERHRSRLAVIAVVHALGRLELETLGEEADGAALAADERADEGR